MTDPNIDIITNYLHEAKPRAVSLIVIRARAELSDYRNRDIAELTKAVETSYLNWCETIAKNDFSNSKSNSHKAIQEGIEQGRKPNQIARTPWIIYEVALKLLSEALDEKLIKALEQTDFIERAERLTTQMSTMGRLSLVTAILDDVKKATRDK